MHFRRVPKFRASPALLFLPVAFLLSGEPFLIFATAVSVLIHECGHLLCARLLKIPVRAVRLDLLGARICVTEISLSYGREFFLAAAGPAASFLFAAVMAVFPPCREIAAVSFLLGALNLLPVRTFDGGRMVSAVLSRRFGVSVSDGLMHGFSLFLLFLLFFLSVWLLLRASGGFSLFCFSVSLLSRLTETEENR